MQHFISHIHPQATWFTNTAKYTATHGEIRTSREKKWKIIGKENFLLCYDPVIVWKDGVTCVRVNTLPFHVVCLYGCSQVGASRAKTSKWKTTKFIINLLMEMEIFVLKSKSWKIIWCKRFVYVLQMIGFKRWIQHGFKVSLIAFWLHIL